MARITVIDIQHKTFKKALQGYERSDVDAFLDEIIETLEDEAQARAALEAEISDMKERISHFKAMEESLQSTLLLAQRTADEVKASAHKEADLIKQEARVQSDREIANLGDRTEDSRREAQRAHENAEKAKSELRSLLMTHLSLLDRAPGASVPVFAPTEARATMSLAATPPSPTEPQAAARHATPSDIDSRPLLIAESVE